MESARPAAQTANIPAAVGRTRRGQPIRPVLLSDLTEELLWPKLRRATGLAMRPERWVLGTVVLTVILLVVRALQGTEAGRLWFAFAGRTLERAREQLALGAGRGDLSGVARGIGRATWALVVDLPLSSPWVTLALAIPTIAVWTLGGAAICRMSALEFGQGVRMAWPGAVGFAISKWKSSAAAMLLAPISAGMILLGLAIGGWVLLNLAYVQVLGALAYPLFMLAGLIAVLMVLGTALGKHLLIPAVSCEGTDALDAVQRAFAYVVASPVRLIAYLLTALVQTGIAAGILWLIASWALGLCSRASMVWVTAPAPGTDDPGWSRRATEAIMGLWEDVPALLVGGFAVSAYFVSSTLIYLLLRRHNDGQDEADLWMPTMVPGTLAEIPTAAGDVAFEDDDE